MITITFYGLDQFVVGDLSRDLTPLVAKLYECKEDDIIFVAPNCMVYHNGVEQTSWNLLMKVDAPLKVKVLQDQMKDLLLNGIGDVAIHKSVIFTYYSQDNRYEKINENYPRFLTEENTVGIEGEDEEETVYREEGDGDDQIYTGDIFKDVIKK